MTSVYVQSAAPPPLVGPARRRPLALRSAPRLAVSQAGHGREQRPCEGDGWVAAGASSHRGPGGVDRGETAHYNAPVHTLLISLLVFVGGFSVMAIELVGGRLLAPYFGSSIYVWGSVIAVFMLALSLGYLAGGALSLRAPSLRRLGLLLMASGLAVLPLVPLATPLLEAVFVRVEDPRYGSLLACAGLFFLPITAMGAISPYAIRLLVETTQSSGQVAGRLYFVSTLGSALGTLMTSFYFVLWFEVNQILIGLATALLAAGALAWWRDRGHPGERRTQDAALGAGGAAEGGR